MIMMRVELAQVPQTGRYQAAWTVFMVAVQGLMTRLEVVIIMMIRRMVKGWSALAQAKDRVIYFNYDSSNIDERAQAIVKAHADYLLKNPNSNIILEGHTDERGSREYNIGLGERRATSVLREFVAYGVPANRVRIVSYGEENPAVTGYNEDAYKRNRRAVIQY